MYDMRNRNLLSLLRVIANKGVKLVYKHNINP
jgi:hypothetical protein